MNKLTKTISEIIKLICLTGIFFVWINFYIRKPFESLIIASLLAFFINLIIIAISRKRQNIYNLKSKEIKEIEEKSKILLFSDPKFVLNFFEKTLKLKFPEVKRNNNYFIVLNQDSKTIFYPFYSKFTLQKDDLLNIINNIEKINFEKDKIIIFANDYSPETTTIQSSLKKNCIIIFDKVQTYKKIFENLNSFPENPNINLKETTIKLNKQDLLNIAFNKKKSKHYLFSGLILLFFSLFSNFDIYYAIFSSLLFILAIFSRYNFKYNKKEEELF